MKTLPITMYKLTCRVLHTYACDAFFICFTYFHIFYVYVCVCVCACVWECARVSERLCLSLNVYALYIISPLFMSYTSHLANVFCWKYDYK